MCGSSIAKEDEGGGRDSVRATLRHKFFIKIFFCVIIMKINGK